MEEMRYEAPESLDAAVAMLTDAGDAARVLAGGTDLLVQLRAGMVHPGVVVDIKNIPEVRAISEEAGGFRVGAAVTGAELGEHTGMCKAWAWCCRGDGTDRLDPDSGPRDDGWEPVQRLACGG